jgi:tetratricopeptide (TPR) repeat protein
MGFFDWLPGKRRDTESRPPTAADRVSRPKLPPPKVLAGLDDDSLHVVIDPGNGPVTVMDRDTFDYLYGESQAPDPCQRDLDELLPRVNRVRAVASGMSRGRVLGTEIILDTSDPQALARFRKTLRILEDPGTFTHCGCLGGPTLELFADQELVATIGLQHGHSIRWAHWKHDARLRDGEALTDWLTRHGVEASLLDVLFHNQYDAGRMMPVGFQRGGSTALSRAEQRVRLAELQRVRGGDLERALAECQKVLDAEPDLAFGYAVRGLIHHQRGDPARCAADCTEAIRLGLKEAEVFFARAVAEDQLGRPQDALADCTAALQVDPRHANAYNSRGLIRARLGQLEEALGDLSEAIRLAPQWPLPYLHRGQAHHTRGQLDEAIADYDRVLELSKQSPPSEGGPLLALIHCRRGEARYDQFQEEEAEADFAEARRRNPAAAAEYLGGLWLRRTKFDRALEEFEQLIRLRPQDPQGYAGRGMCQEALAELDQAADDYSTAIRLQSDGGVAYALRARVRQRQGRPEEALADWSEHLQLHPDDAMAYLSRSALNKQRGALAEALDDLNAAHRVAPDHPMVCNNLAWMLATCADDRLRDGQRAVELARQACEGRQWQHGFCLGTLGAACAETGAFDEAIRWQTQALELYPAEEKPAGQARLELYRARRPYRE